MRDAGIGWPEVDGIAVSLGPGSFTGLRIGMATAKGLAAAAGTGLYGVSTLDLLAAGSLSAGLICSVVDARKKQVYTALYRGDGAGSVSRLTEPQVLSPVEFAATIDQPVLMVGDGAVLYAELFAERLGGLFCLAPAPVNQVSAVWLGFLAADLWRRGEALDLAASSPLYIRRSDAELNLKAQAGGK
jgi:tRNA threonylcarbamoyladenosine biosynthesis protein TsaB